MGKHAIELQFRALESIVANPALTGREKIRAIRRYERLLSKQSGITLKAMKEVGGIINSKGLSKMQVLNELRALENVFVEGALKTSKEGGKPLTREQCRKIFSGYVNQHFQIKIGRRLRMARLARKSAKIRGRAQKPKRF